MYYIWKELEIIICNTSFGIRLFCFILFIYSNLDIHEVQEAE